MIQKTKSSEIYRINDRATYWRPADTGPVSVDINDGPRNDTAPAEPTVTADSGD